MALTHLFVSFSLLMSLTFISFAYGSDSYGYVPQSSLEKPMPYEPKPSLEKQNPSVYEPKPFPEEKPKPLAYEPKPTLEKPKTSGYQLKSSLDVAKVEEFVMYKRVGVQGIIYCDMGSKRIPLEGAVAKLTCLSTEVEGYEYAPVISVLSEVTDKNGYFFATLDLAVLLKSKVKLSDCKVLLHKSPSKSCKIPTDVNNGITGSFPSTYSLLTHNKMKLFSVGPFVYGSVPESDNGGY